MSDPYQLGSDADWLKHSNEELGRLIQKRNRQLMRLRLFCLLLLAGLGWVLYKFCQTQSIDQLWR